MSAIANKMHPTDVPIDAAAIFRENGILLIGATGFMGKATVALLLDRYPDLKKLYVLCRPKSGRSAEQRFYGETANSPALAPSVEKLGLDFVRRKIQVLEGDVSAPLCGLSPDQIKELTGAMKLAIKAEDFEKAARCRDQIKELGEKMKNKE